MILYETSREVSEIIPLISIRQHLRIKSTHVATKPTNKNNAKKHKHFLLKREDEPLHKIQITGTQNVYNKDKETTRHMLLPEQCV